MTQPESWTAADGPGGRIATLSWVALMVAVTLVATLGFALASAGTSEASVGSGSSPKASAGVASHFVAAAHHRRTPIRRTSPSAS